MHLLLVEDQLDLASVIARRMRSLGHSIECVSSIDKAKVFLRDSPPDVLIMDRMVTDGDTVSWLKAMRRAGDKTPVLLLTGRSDVTDRVEGLEAGADDYLVKPFAMDELAARVHVLARRKETIQASVLQIGDLVVDLAAREVRRAGVLIPLRPKEHVLLHLLVSRAGEAVSRSDILDACWDRLDGPQSNVEEVLVRSLRTKLGPPDLITTVRGVGYRFSAPD